MHLRCIDSPASGGNGPRLGFGCSSLGGGLAPATQCRIIEAAYEAGFRHFDVAPSYADGEAEGVLAIALAGVRSQVSIVTKAGIAHPHRSGIGALKRLRRIASPLKTMVPGIWSAASRKAARVAAPMARFAPEQVTASLEESLRRLCSDSVDALLLHQATAADLSPGLFNCLDQLLAKRLVGAVGVGTDVDECVRIAALYPDRFDVFQMNHHWGARTPTACPPSATRITHRAIRTGLDLLEDPALRRALESHALHRELASARRDTASMADLFLLAALRRCSEGLVLVSTSRPERARHLVALAGRTEMLPLADALNDCLDLVAPSPSSG